MIEAKHRLAANYGRLVAFHLREGNAVEVKAVLIAYDRFVSQFPTKEWGRMDRWYYEAQGTVLIH